MVGSRTGRSKLHGSLATLIVITTMVAAFLPSIGAANAAVTEEPWTDAPYFTLTDTTDVLANVYVVSAPSGNIECGDLDTQADGELKIDTANPTVGVPYTSSDGLLELTITSHTTDPYSLIAFEVAPDSPRKVSSVFIKTGSGEGAYYVYVDRTPATPYTVQTVPSTGDEGLHPHINPNTGRIYEQFSHISFCYVDVPPETYDLTLTKVDADTEAVMVEVGFELFTDETMLDEIGDEQFTDTDGEIVWTDLLPGTYWIHESTVPDGYDPMDPNPMEVEIVDQDVSVTIDNTLTPVPPETYELTLLKIDGFTEEAMVGVGFTLYTDEDMESPVGTEKLTDTDGEIVWTELLPGTYWLFESTVPTGYDPMTPNPLEVEIVDQDVSVTIDNTLTPVPPETYELTLLKIDGFTEEAMVGVGFTLYTDEDMESPVGTEKLTDTDGEIVWTELLPGTYWLFESTVPTGYDPMTPNPLEVEIVDQDVSVTIDNTLTPIPPDTYDLTLTKIDADTEAAMPSVGFELYTDEAMESPVGTEKLTDTDGEIVWTELLPGTYWLFESTVPTGYEPMTPNPMEVEIVDEDVTLTIENEGAEVLPGTLGLELVKTAQITPDADGDKVVEYDAGDPDGAEVVYLYEITNTGTVPITDLDLTDDVLGDIVLPKTTIEPGEKITATATHLVTGADADEGEIVNVATVTGDSELGAVEVSDTETVLVAEVKGILVVTGADSGTIALTALLALLLGAALVLTSRRRSAER